MAKRLFDIFVSLLASIVFAPFLVATAVIVRIFLGYPVFFRQIRPGLNGQLFEMVKFRTMIDRRDVSGVLLPDTARLTRFGRFLRASSVDELPELWNVLKGDMSLVGPRPLLVEYLDHYTDDQRRRHNVRPGITGWAQVKGRNALTWDEKFAYDLWYVDNHSFALDIKIMIMTVWKLIAREGISHGSEATMPRFGGDHGANQPK